MNGRKAKQLKKVAKALQYHHSLPWRSYRRVGRLNDCGLKFYRLFKRNYTRFKHPLGEAQ